MSKDKNLRKEYRQKPCIVCGSVPSDPTHVKTYAVTRMDERGNLVPLCRMHHVEQHTIGILSFINKYPNYRDHIFKMGFEIFNGKLILND